MLKSTSCAQFIVTSADCQCEYIFNCWKVGRDFCKQFNALGKVQLCAQGLSAIEENAKEEGGEEKEGDGRWGDWQRLFDLQFVLQLNLKL